MAQDNDKRACSDLFSAELPARSAAEIMRAYVSRAGQILCYISVTIRFAFAESTLESANDRHTSRWTACRQLACVRSLMDWSVRRKSLVLHNSMPPSTNIDYYLTPKRLIFKGCYLTNIYFLFIYYLRPCHFNLVCYLWIL